MPAEADIFNLDPVDTEAFMASRRRLREARIVRIIEGLVQLDAADVEMVRQLVRVLTSRARLDEIVEHCIEGENS
jgi:hypothetical protein